MGMGWIPINLTPALGRMHIIDRSDVNGTKECIHDAYMYVETRMVLLFHEPTTIQSNLTVKQESTYLIYLHHGRSSTRDGWLMFMCV